MRDASGTLVLAWYGSIDEPDDVDVTSWYAPFDFMFEDDVCTAEPPDRPDDSSAFIDDPCPSIRERAAFMIVSPWAMGFVYDDTAAPFGDYEVRVPWADTQTPLDDTECGEARTHGSVCVLPRK